MFWLCNLQGRLPPWVKLPCSAALPFGAFEAVLQQPENAAAAAAVQQLGDEQQPLLQQLDQVRTALQDLQANAQLQDELTAAFQQSGKHFLPRCFSTSALQVTVCLTCALTVPVWVQLGTLCPLPEVAQRCTVPVTALYRARKTSQAE